MIDISNTKIEFETLTEEGEEVLKCLKVLYSTPAGTVPLDRDLGIDMGVIDLPINIAHGKFTVQIIEKTRKYEPRVRVRGVDFKRGEDPSGSFFPKVVVSLA